MKDYEGLTSEEVHYGEKITVKSLRSILCDHFFLSQLRPFFRREVPDKMVLCLSVCTFVGKF